MSKSPATQAGGRLAPFLSCDLGQHLRRPQHADNTAPPHQGKTPFALLVSLLREEAEVNFGLEGPVPSVIIPGKEPGQEAAQMLGHLQRRKPECYFQPIEAPSTLLPTVMPTLTGSPFKLLTQLGNFKVWVFCFIFKEERGKLTQCRAFLRSCTRSLHSEPSGHLHATLTHTGTSLVLRGRPRHGLPGMVPNSRLAGPKITTQPFFLAPTRPPVKSPRIGSNKEAF